MLFILDVSILSSLSSEKRKEFAARANKASERCIKTIEKYYLALY